MRRALDAAAALGGLLYVLVGISGLLLVIPAIPFEDTAAPSEVAAGLAEHPAGTVQWVGLSMEFAAELLLVLFAYRLLAHLAADRAADWAAQAAASLALAGVTVKLASFAPGIVGLGYTDQLTAEDQALLFRINGAASTVSDALITAFVILAGILILNGDRMPAWLGYFAIGAALVNVVEIYAWTGYLFLPLLLWYPAASIVLVRQLHRHPTPDTDNMERRAHGSHQPSDHRYAATTHS